MKLSTKGLKEFIQILESANKHPKLTFIERVGSATPDFPTGHPKTPDASLPMIFAEIIGIVPRGRDYDTDNYTTAYASRAEIVSEASERAIARLLLNGRLEAGDCFYQRVRNYLDEQKSEALIRDCLLYTSPSPRD